VLWIRYPVRCGSNYRIRNVMYKRGRRKLQTNNQDSCMTKIWRIETKKDEAGIKVLMMRRFSMMKSEAAEEWVDKVWWLTISLAKMEMYKWQKVRMIKERKACWKTCAAGKLILMKTTTVSSNRNWRWNIRRWMIYRDTRKFREEPSSCMVLRTLGEW